jgi:osmotically-inducible protein OsmY
MKSDAQLKQDVVNELEWDPAIEATHVGVAVSDGVVVLTGHLRTFAAKHAVEQAVKRVAGVRAIAIELDVQLDPHHERGDADIAVAIETAFKWHAQIPEDRIRIEVEKGWVTLTGEVDWDYQRHNAELVVRPVTGVVGVVNQITIRQRSAPEYVARRIREALARYADEEWRGIEVKVDGSTVTLLGSVNSWAERSAVQAAAWAAPGITQVVNQLEIAA